MTPWNDSLVVGMASPKIGGVSARNIARWDGSAWGPMGAGFNYWVYGVTIYDGQPVALGPMQLSGTTTVNGAARWDGSSWQPLGAGFNVFVGEWPYAGAQWGSDLIVVGDFTVAGGVPAEHVARWDGSAWHALGSGVDGFAGALAVFEGDLIVGGLFTHAGGAPAGGVARWNGSAWSAMGPSAVEVHILRVVDGRLFAGGEFLCADGSEVYGVAIWNGQDWVLTGSGFGPAYFYFIEPWNGDLYVGGSFGWANGHAAFNIARLAEYASVGVGPPGRIVAVRLRAPLPNPSARSAELRFELPVATRGRLAIFDVSGRRIATLAQGLLPAGANSATWSGRNDRGRLCGAGLYFARLETALGARSVKLVRSR